MKTLLRLVSAVIICIMVISLMPSCHGSGSSSGFEVPENFDTSAEHEITFWAKNDTNKNQTAIYAKAIEDFESVYPNITVRIKLYTDYSKIYNDVITNISTDTTPNVCITYPDHIATYITGENTVVPLDELISDSRYGFGGSEILYDSPSADELEEKFLGEGVINGKNYALPFMRSTEACYVNKTFVEKLGYELPEVLTWDFIWEVSEAATEKDSDGNYIVNGQKTMIPFIYKSSDNMLITMLRQLGAGYSTDEGGIEIFNDDTTSILKQVASHTKSGAFSTFKISGYPANFLNAGQCIFAVDSTAGSTWMGSDAPLSDISEDRIVEFETEVFPVPQYDADSPLMISQGPSVCIFNKEDPQEVLASWLFAQFLLTDEIQIGYSETEGYIPVTTSAVDSEEYKEYLAASGDDDTVHYSIKIDAVKLLIANIDNTFVTPVFNGSTSLRSAASQLIEDVAKSVRRKKTVDDAYIEKLYEDVTSLYRLDSIRTTESDEVYSASDLGPLPVQAVVLLCVIGAVWVILAAVNIRDRIREKRKRLH